MSKNNTNPTATTPNNTFTTEHFPTFGDAAQAAADLLNQSLAARDAGNHRLATALRDACNALGDSWQAWG